MLVGSSSRKASSLATTEEFDTVIVIVVLLVKAPPLPVLPRSSISTSSVASPSKSVAEVKVAPLMARLTSLSVPLKVMVSSAVPSPTSNVSPVVKPSENAPCVAAIVTLTGLFAASWSPKRIALSDPCQKVRDWFLWAYN